MAIVKFNPDLSEGGLAAGYKVPRGAAIRSLLGKGDQTACEYRTAHDVWLWPIQVAEAHYHTQDLGNLEIPAALQAKAAIRLRIRATAGPFKETALDRLNVHLHGVGDQPMRLYEQLFAHAAAVIVQPPGRPAAWKHVCAPPDIRRVGFDDDTALLPYGPRSFQGYRLLHEYFTFPQRYMFVELGGLAGALRRCEGRELDVIVVCRQADLLLENTVEPANFELFCSPAINLFPKRADRVHLADRFSEHHVVPDRTRPLDFEVYEVTGVTGFGARADTGQEFKPFYSASDFEAGGGGGAYYAVNRVPRTLSAREAEFGPRSGYTGSEAYVSLVDARSAPYRSDLSQLAVATLCTNRDLPLQMPVGQGKTDFTMELSAPTLSIRCVGRPSAPRPSYAEGETAWRLISHLSLNYLSLIDTDARAGAAALRELLRLYGNAGDPQVAKQIDGLRSVTSAPVMRRAATPGPITFARGLAVSLLLDEAAFEGTGVFLLGAVLERFLAKYVSINSFTEAIINTAQRGEVMRWPARLGNRQIL